MEIVGKVISVLPLQGGVSASGKEWQLETFVIETLETYPKKIAIELFGKERIENNPVAEGGTYTVSFDIESREYNGRWYTSVRAWKVVNGVVQQPAPEAVAEPETVQIFPDNNSMGDANGDLPF